MADIYDTFRDIGIIPVVAIEDASKAADLAHALVKGGSRLQKLHSVQHVLQKQSKLWLKQNQTCS